MNRVAVNPKLVTWARQRAYLAVEDLADRFPKLPSWEGGELKPTFKQLEEFARVTHVPFGYLFLPEAPQITLPISDLRTLDNQYNDEVSQDLLDTIYAMQR